MTSEHGFLPDLLPEEGDLSPSKLCFVGPTASSGIWGTAAPIVVTEAVVGNISADIVANMPLGWRSSGDVNRPEGPDGQQQLAGRYTLAWNGEGLKAEEGNNSSESVLKTC